MAQPMNPTVKIILLGIACIVLGSIVNMACILIMGKMIPPPDGVDTSNMESIKQHIGSYSVMQLMPAFIAHALGTFVSCFVASNYGGNNGKFLSFVIAGVFLAGGISAIVQIGGPTWFKVLDLAVAYFPMAWLANKLGTSK